MHLYFVQGANRTFQIWQACLLAGKNEECCFFNGSQFVMKPVATPRKP